MTTDDPDDLPSGSPSGWALDPRLQDFLLDRLHEEVAAASRRRHAAPQAPQASLDVAERGRRILDELLATVEAGDVPDRMSLDLLTVAYADHPGFDAGWNRWRAAASA